MSVGDTARWWSLSLDKIGTAPLPLLPAHVAAIADLPPIHQDPFDRALIARATVGGLILLTSDRMIPQYDSERFRVLV